MKSNNFFAASTQVVVTIFHISFRNFQYLGPAILHAVLFSIKYFMCSFSHSPWMTLLLPIAFPFPNVQSVLCAPITGVVFIPTAITMVPSQIFPTPQASTSLQVNHPFISFSI